VLAQVESTMNRVHAIIITLNEQVHLKRCIDSLRGQCASVTVVDSFSTDGTEGVARQARAHFVQNRFVNHAAQINFAIDRLADRGGWLLRIDADEILDSDGYETLQVAVAGVAERVDGLLVQRRIHFLGRRIRHGTIEPSWQLRLWRNGRGRCEQRWMDEHIIVGGRVAKSGLVLSDINLNSVTWWTAKHNSYASREAVELLNLRHRFSNVTDSSSAKMSQQARRRRFVKENIYSRIPSGLRALIYFLYRYVLRLGFLDGREGWYFHLLQAFWYRSLVDAKVFEIEQLARTRGLTLPQAIEHCVGIDISGKSKVSEKTQS
jgi:glycosyltransferase involved in cell wall biosynthesis